MRSKSTSRRIAAGRKSARNQSFFSKYKFRISILGICLLFFLVVGNLYWEPILYYLSFKSKHMSFKEAEAKRISDRRNEQVLESHQDFAIGIDISQYQGDIDWDLVDNVENDYPIEFVLVRATAGNNKKDTRFDENWAAVKTKNMIRGAYHYYRPDENSEEQAQLFINTVKLNQGDLPPVLDIEKLPRGQSLERLKIGLSRWLERVEAHYKVKPIIYTGEKYYDDFLKKDFSEYLFWIANYNYYRGKIGEDWLFWQFTEKATVSGINGNVDVNIFNGDLQQLQHITIEK